ncbi:PhzF family phenazine biosynthesis protein [Fulvivirgaceae bacterium LMO-SS25]
MGADIQLISVFGKEQHNLLGNVSAVVWLEYEITASKMQQIASDLNQPATTFLCEHNDEIKVKWFAPDAEIGLCGHGSLAAIAFLSNRNNTTTAITLNYAGGEIIGAAIDENHCQIQINAIPTLEEKSIPALLTKGLGVPIIGYFKTSNKDIVLLESEEDVKNMKPNFALLRQSEVFGYAVTAAAKKVDFVSRTLVPHVQQLEDHATGSSHAALVPFWANKLNKQKLVAIQHSPRGGYFDCEIQNDDIVTLEGEFRTIFKGKLTL